MLYAADENVHSVLHLADLSWHRSRDVSWLVSRSWGSPYYACPIHGISIIGNDLGDSTIIENRPLTDVFNIPSLLSLSMMPPMARLLNKLSCIFFLSPRVDAYCQFREWGASSHIANRLAGRCARNRMREAKLSPQKIRSRTKPFSAISFPWSNLHLPKEEPFYA